MSNLSDAIAAYKIAYPKVKIRDKSTPLSISLDDEASCFEELANLLLPNGVISGLGFALDISNNLIVQPGVWQIDRVQYNTTIISTFALDAQDPTLSRYDVIYAGTDNLLHLLSGDLSADPIIPNIPDSAIQVCTALVTPTVITLGNPFPNDYVDLISNQIINGVKTFNRSPQVPNGANPQDAVAFNQLSTVLNESFANGVTSLGGNVFGFGGSLNRNTTITGTTFNLIFDGKVAVTATPVNSTDVLRLGDVVLADGVINGCNLSISGTTATVQPGRWRISNVIYQSTVVTTLTLDAQDATLSRFDVIYADNTNTFHVLSGVLSASPDVPVIPAGTLEIAEILITPTTVTTTPTPPITNFVNTTTNQGGIVGTKSWDGVQIYNNDVHFGANIYASAIPSGDVFSNNAGSDLILQAGLVYVTQPYRFNYQLPLGSNVGDYTIFADIVNFDSFNNAKMNMVLVNNPGDASFNITTLEYEFLLDFQCDPTKWYIISPNRRDGGTGYIDYALEIQRSVNTDSAGIAYSYKLRVRRTIIETNTLLGLAVWMEATPIYGITRALTTGNDTTPALNYYSAQISFVGQDIFDSDGNMFAKTTGTFMPIAGGSFTGPVSFSADPTTNLGGATKQYVDTKLAATKVYFGPNTFIPGGPTFSDDPGTINNPYIFSATGINGQLLTGFSSTTGVVTGSDSILTSIEKLYGNQATYVPLSGGIMTGFLTLSADPTNASHAATKSYVDNFLTGITWKQEVKAATTANITLSGTQTIDGYSVAIGDRILVKNQTTATGNGIYLVALGVWTRTTDADSGTEIGSATVLVRLGTVNKDTQWTCTNTTDPVIGTDNITFGQIAGAGTYTNGTGLDLTGNVFSVNSTYVRGLFSATSPIFYDSGTGIISSQAASGSQAGYVSSTDWTTFNNKQPTLNPVAVQTGNYSVLAFNFVPVDTTAGSSTMTLPNAPADKTQVAIKHVIQGGTNVVTINTSGSDVFNKAGGATTFSLSLLAQGVWLQYRSSTAIWYILADDIALSQLDLRFSPLAGSGSITTLGTIASGSIPYSLVTGGPPANPMSALGDIIYGGASGVETRLPGNTTTTQKFLTQTGNGTISAAPAYFDLFGSANTFTAIQNVQNNGLTTTIADGFIVANSTASLSSGATVQNSPNLRISSTAYGSTLATSQKVDFYFNVQPTTSATPFGSLNFYYQLNNGTPLIVQTINSGGGTVYYNTVNQNINFIGATSTDGYLANNNATPSAGTPLQKSSAISLQGGVWNTKVTAAANYFKFRSEASAISSAAPVGKYVIYGGLGTSTTVAVTEIFDLYHYGGINLIPQAATINAWANSTEANATGALLNIGGATLTDGISATGTLTYAFGTSFSSPTFAATNTGVVFTNAATVHIGPAPSAGTNVTLTTPLSLLVDGNSTFSSNVTISGTATITSPLLGLFNSTNIYTASVSNLTGNITAAWYAFDGSSNASLRTGFYGSTTAVVGSGNSYGSVVVGASVFSVTASTTSPWGANLVVKKMGTVTIGGGGVVTNSASLFIEGASAYATNNYAAYIAGNGIIGLAGSTSGVITLQTQAAAGTYNWNWPITVGSVGQVLTSQGGGSTAMTWTSAPVIQASNDLQAQTSAGNITTFIVGGSTATFNISAYLNVTAVVTDVIQIQITYTDENNTAQTISFTTLNTVTDSSYNPVTIRAKNATVITVKSNLTTGVGSITFDAGARIVQM